jgi:hypothetical protein
MGVRHLARHPHLSELKPGLLELEEAVEGRRGHLLASQGPASLEPG